ncbi:MAG: deoxyguanosinetriphosphate triphosphohydrolase [Nitrospirae bacterium CG08_land_8_20_14_0_20_52_24]|nr:MAG: deoxyguanosinetriphosphate triphosphohydrolase [Nitrospirae bacterium CG08_land_8_20_14_0_20_52_24]
MTHTYEKERPDLAPYAARSEASRGRRYPEHFKDNRTDFQRDRDRIIHCAAFRRLEYKTQVFVNHEGDYYRTRLTHTLEVSQIARGTARAMGLNEELAEAIALAHDLGHTPFGHSGEDLLNELMKDHGGFEHNRQSLRIVEELEERYPNFSGLNLTFETREGIIKHTSFHDRPDITEIKDFLPGVVPTLEAQIINLADEIAYNNHDIDDGLTSGLLDLCELRETAPIVDRTFRQIETLYPGIDETRKKYQAISYLIGYLINDLVHHTTSMLKEHDIRTLDDLRDKNIPVVSFSPEVMQENSRLKEFLSQNLYTHYRVERMRIKGKMVLSALFNIYRENPTLLPQKYQRMIEQAGRERVICDYIAGMTDRYALDEYKKLFEPFERT